VPFWSSLMVRPVVMGAPFESNSVPLMFWAV